MEKTVHFYFDFSSPYGYLAAMRIDALAEKYQREVEWHPILLGAVFKITGCLPLTQVPLKGKYSEHDFARTARFHQIPFSMPDVFPISTQHAARAMLWVAKTQGKENARKFAQTLFRAYFVQNINISELDKVLEMAAIAGMDVETLKLEMSGQEMKDRLKTEVEQAIQLGVFGSPFIIIDGEPFWGFDRFDQMEALLKHGQI